MARVRTAIGTLAVCALLGACTAAGAEPQGLPTSPTTASTPTPTPTPSPTATALTTHDLSDAKLGIVFVDTPNLTGAAASAHDAVAIFEREYWRSLTTGTVSPLIAQVALAKAQSLVENSVQLNAKNGLGLAGTIRASISDVTVDTEKGSARLCEDGLDVQFTRAGKPPQNYAEAGFTRKHHSTLTLRSADGGKTWAVESYGTMHDGC